MGNIKNIVFDIGNVLLKWEPEKLYETMFGKNEFEKHHLDKIVGSEIWLELDRGTMTIEEVISKVKLQYPESIEEIGRFIREVAFYIQPIEDSFNFADECKAMGMKIYLLSNFSEEGYNVIRERFDIFNIFDGGVISWEVKTIKPEKEIYEILLDKYALSPEETLFIDDVSANIEAAEKLGITGFHMTEGTECRKALSLSAVKN